jgi:hypothetical protein
MHVDHRPTRASTPPTTGTARLDRRRLLRRSAVALAVPAAVAVVGRPTGWARRTGSAPTPVTPTSEGAEMTSGRIRSGQQP